MSHSRFPGPLTVAELVRIGPLSRGRSCGSDDLERQVAAVALISALDSARRSVPGTALVVHPAAAHGVWALESALRLAWECNAACVVAPNGITVTSATTQLAERLRMPLFIVDDPCDLALELAATIADAEAARARLTARCAALFSGFHKARDILKVINTEIPGVSVALLARDGYLLAGRGAVASSGRRGQRIQVDVPGPDGRSWATLVAQLPDSSCAWSKTVESILILARAPLALSVAHTRLTSARRVNTDRLLLEALLGEKPAMPQPAAPPDGTVTAGPEQLAREAGWRIDGRHTAVYLRPVKGQEGSGEEVTSGLIAMWHEAFPGLPIAPAPRGWVTWFTDDRSHPKEVASQVGRALAALRFPIPITAGVGQEGEGISGLRRSVTEADLAAAVAGRRMGGTVERYSELGLQVVLAGLPTEEIADAASILLRDLCSDPKADILITTLSTLLDCAGSTGQAAARLGVHRNTMLGRLERLRSCGVDLESPDQRLALHVACYALLADRFRMPS